MKYVAYIGFYRDGTYQAILAREIYESDCSPDDPQLEHIEHSQCSKDLNYIQEKIYLMQKANKNLEAFFAPVEIVLSWLPIYKSLILSRQEQNTNVSIKIKRKYRRKI